ncbi:MAG: class I SAM-dependent methyltransferase [Heliobacteriaceae bacterium]|jgi:SAM-dependent methyltransferase|nr:class I SAM-dependent methyltransferase [Heliobacteriaceae bacterium]
MELDDLKRNLCRICGNFDDNKIYTAREMMFGFRHEFDYIECSKCGCVQIVEIPKNINKYYPPNYYSFRFKPGPKLPFIERFNLFSKRIRKEDVNNWCINYMQDHISYRDKIIDVGCGSGKLIYHMKNAWLNVCGYDPFIKEKIVHNNGVVIYKDINEIKNKKFSVVIMKHSFEHMSNPQEMFNLVSEKLLSKNGKFILSIPLALWAWKKYRTNWVQLDAPRHFFLHTPESVRILAGNSGFRINEVTFNSNAFQFWGSEQFVKDIHLESKESYFCNHNKEAFTREQIIGFRRQANELNQLHQGDQATFILTR